VFLGNEVMETLLRSYRAPVSSVTTM